MALVEFMLTLLWGMAPAERRAPRVLVERSRRPSPEPFS